jgi:hypothetical protein
MPETRQTETRQTETRQTETRQTETRQTEAKARPRPTFALSADRERQADEFLASRAPDPAARAWFRHCLPIAAAAAARRFEEHPDQWSCRHWVTASREYAHDERSEAWTAYDYPAEHGAAPMYSLGRWQRLRAAERFWARWRRDCEREDADAEAAEDADAERADADAEDADAEAARWFLRDLFRWAAAETEALWAVQWLAPHISRLRCWCDGASDADADSDADAEGP